MLSLKWEIYLNLIFTGTADATANHLLLLKIQSCLTFLVPAHPDCPRKEAVKCSSVVVVVFTGIFSLADVTSVSSFQCFDTDD